MNKQQLEAIISQMSRFTVPKKVRINSRFMDHLVNSGMLEKRNPTGSFSTMANGVPVVIDDTVSTFKFEY